MKNIRNFLIVLSFIVLSFGLGYRFGHKNADSISQIPFANSKDITGKVGSLSPTVDFSLFWDVWDLLSKSYIDKKSLDPQKMVYGAISGMVSAIGDPYTLFLPPSENQEAKNDLNGNLEGIGAQLGVKDKKIIVIAPLKGSPAEKAGLRPGDWIQKVDGKETFDWTIQDAISKIRGPKGTKVTLNIVTKEASKPAEVAITRDAIQVSSVEWELKSITCNGNSCAEVKEDCSLCKKVAYLKLARFGDQTPVEWEKAVTEINDKVKTLNRDQFEGLVFDVRNNPGGYLTAAVYIGSEFLKDGTVVIQENANGSRDELKVNRKGNLLTTPLVVLVNRGSASASEIVAGALKVRGRARLVGEQSFGKGTIQQALDLKSNAGIHVTTAKWLLPDGSWIHGTGVLPDVKVENKDTEPDHDYQLEEAYKELSK